RPLSAAAVPGFLFQCSSLHLDLHSFPTRRSSDLGAEGQRRPLARGRIVVDDEDAKTVEARGSGLAADARRHRRGLDGPAARQRRSEEHTSELQSRENLVCRLLLEKKKINKKTRCT